MRSRTTGGHTWERRHKRERWAYHLHPHPLQWHTNPAFLTPVQSLGWALVTLTTAVAVSPAPLRAPRVPWMHIPLIRYGGRSRHHRHLPSWTLLKEKRRHAAVFPVLCHHLLCGIINALRYSGKWQTKKSGCWLHNLVTVNKALAIEGWRNTSIYRSGHSVICLADLQYLYFLAMFALVWISVF